MRGALIPSILIASGLAIAMPSSSRAQDARSDLAGTWQFNPEHSDDTEQLAREAGRGLPRPPGAKGVLVGPREGIATGGPPIGIAGGFGMPRGFDPELIRQAVAEAMVTAERLVLAFKGDTLLLSLDGTAPYVIVTNGKKLRRAWVDGSDVEIKASWKGRQLRIERKLENELKVTDTYQVDPESQRLVITTKVDGPIPRDIEVDRVYDPVTDPSG